MKEIKMVKNINHAEIDFDADGELMDDDLREELAVGVCL